MSQMAKGTQTNNRKENMFSSKPNSSRGSAEQQKGAIIIFSESIYVSILQAVLFGQTHTNKVRCTNLQHQSQKW